MNLAAVDGRSLPIFIHRELDDLGLDPYAFRIYARLARRAGGPRGAFESVSSMADGCRMSERKARDALRELEDRRLVEREQRPGETSVYRLTDTDAWRTPAPHAAPTPAPDAALPRHHMPPTPAPHAAEGNQVKVPRLKVEVEDEDAHAQTANLNHDTKQGKALAGLLNADARTQLRMQDPDTFKLLERAASSLKWTLPQKIGAATIALDRPTDTLEALAITIESRDGITGSTFRYWKATLDSDRSPKPATSNGKSSAGGRRRKPWDVTGGDAQNRNHPDYAPVRGQSIEARQDIEARTAEATANDRRRALRDQVANLLGG